jgi:uncharacterized protein with FMN-binding domain
MRRITFWLLSTLTVVVMLFGFDASHRNASTAITPPAATSGTSSGSSSGSTGSSGSSGATGSSRASGSGSKANKTVTGAVASTQWGPVQVQVKVSGGKITDVTMLQQTSGNPMDDQINSYALPILKQETIRHQSANIDMVSGATVTSTGYIQSLQSALDQAGL